jgi:pyridoxamine 5'-phosphate oxidase
MFDPLMLLADDRKRARVAGDPWANLCVLATIDAQQIPQARVVVLRDLEQRFAVFINGTSPKYAELELSRHKAVLVYLASLGVQYRLTVSFEPVPIALVRKSWLDRPRIPKVMDWLYEQFQPQSSAVPSRDDLVERYAAIDAQLASNVAAPAGAIGLYLVAEYVERLELASDRIHTRTSYRRDGAIWHTTELIP